MFIWKLKNVQGLDSSLLIKLARLERKHFGFHEHNVKEDHEFNLEEYFEYVKNLSFSSRRLSKEVSSNSIKLLFITVKDHYNIRTYAKFTQNKSIKVIKIHKKGKYIKFI